MSLSSQTTTTIPQKRPLPEEEAEIVQATPKRDTAASPQSSSALSTPLTIDSTQESPLQSSATQPRPSSPTPSSNTSVSGERRSSLQNGTSTAVPTKRRRLTEQEKEEKRLEKEVKERERAELKAKREEEKRIKDEERRQKNEEREEKKREKELEKQQKEDEKLKKDRSQLRLNSFFTPKNSTAVPTSPTKHGVITKEAARRKSLTLEPDIPLLVSQTVPSSHQQGPVSDYELFFLPFSLPSNTVCAPHNAFLPDEATLLTVREKLDGFAQVHIREQDASFDYPTATSIPTLDCVKAERSIRDLGFPSVREIIARLHGSSNNPIDLTDDNDSAEIGLQPLELLKSVPMKYLHFGEDVRPPYYGTFTRIQSRQTAVRLSRNPLSRALTEVNYDYDSEAEWEEPEEGEDVDSDLDSDGEEDMESNEGDDMEGFLDDEGSIDPAKTRRGIISGDLEPVCSGLCWEDSSGQLLRTDGSAEHVDLGDCAIGFLLDPEPHTIDPWSMAYWPDEPTTAAPATTATKDPSPMNPPRLPLHARPNGIFNNVNITSPSLKKQGTNATAPIPKPVKAGKRMVPDEYMQEFKQAIEGSDLTKIALIEALKKRFPKLPKDAINNTLSTIGARIGSKEVDKRWVLVPNSWFTH